MKINLNIGPQNFSATLEPTPAAKAFYALLPLILDMTELNGNEKYADLPKELPVKASCPEKIETGDLMLYGSSTFVLFYESFSTRYEYTRLGRLDDPYRLASALGKGDVRVTFLKG